MRYSSGILLLCISLACNDGDLQIETIDFDSVAIQFCEAPPTTSSTVFFKINTDEALIVELQPGILQNEVSDTPISSEVPGESMITYRIFSDDVSTNYFCDDVPPTTPTVIEEIISIGGQVIVNTTRSESDTTMYLHKIELSGISLVNDQGERITDTSINDFGTITTTLDIEN